MAEDPNEKRDLVYYSAAVSLIVHAETTSQRRTAGYLIGAGLLFNAWPQVRAIANAGMLVACTGVGVSILFLLLALRTRAFVDAYVKTAKRLEGDKSGPVKDADLGGFPLGKITSIAVPLLGLVAFAALVGLSLAQTSLPR